jgi:hypothetical protein
VRLGENTILSSAPSTASSAEPVVVVLHDGGPMLVLLVAAFVLVGTPIVPPAAFIVFGCRPRATGHTDRYLVLLVQEYSRRFRCVTGP